MLSTLTNTWDGQGDTYELGGPTERKQLSEEAPTALAALCLRAPASFLPVDDRLHVGPRCPATFEQQASALAVFG